ncbi:hypothetical protein GIB67_026468 [Kingdonia uniflora]|uniref:DNA-directed RNA polymerase n=1 Tax=Kingdonia uniflora TaxID=39325 RepID=A0A7J7P6K9_9MAGN|nr:hypothetical protein GIB67_026468 [Kingdonia uniflora]
MDWTGSDSVVGSALGSLAALGSFAGLGPDLVVESRVGSFDGPGSDSIAGPGLLVSFGSGSGPVAGFGPGSLTGPEPGLVVGPSPVLLKATGGGGNILPGQLPIRDSGEEKLKRSFLGAVRNLGDLSTGYMDLKHIDLANSRFGEGEEVASNVLLVLTRLKPNVIIGKKCESLRIFSRQNISTRNGREQISEDLTSSEGEFKDNYDEDRCGWSDPLSWVLESPVSVGVGVEECGRGGLLMQIKIFLWNARGYLSWLLSSLQIKINGGTKNVPCSYCPEIPQISIREAKSKDGASCIELKVRSTSKFHDDFWFFLERYGFRYSDGNIRSLLPSEVLAILKKIPEETQKKLEGKGYFPQDGFILQNLPVPPNCLSVPEVSDGVSVMSSDRSISELKKVLKQVEIIKSSRAGPPNFESHAFEANDLQLAITKYLNVRGTTQASSDFKTRYGPARETDESSTKAWLEKMRTLFIKKGSGFSSRSVITGDSYKRVDEIGIPLEIAQKITFEEKVTEHNKEHLQKLVDERLCLTYRDGASTYSLVEGSKGHTSLRVDQVVNRRIMDGDIVFINRPPSTHKHSLQAFSVYVHSDHTVKINPLICEPLGADFDGDCIHLFYPQSLAAKAEVIELFSVDQQLLSSHTGKLNLQFSNDALLSLKIMFETLFFDKASAQQLAMFVPAASLARPCLFKANSAGSKWSALQILQTSLPVGFDCFGERYSIIQSEILKVDYNRDVLKSMFNEIIASVFLKEGSKEALKVFNSLQPLLMENIFFKGYSVSLKDFSIPVSLREDIQRSVQKISPLLYHLRSSFNELVEMQVENHLKSVKLPADRFVLRSSALGNLIDSKSESSINKVIQQIGFLGLQLSDRGKFYSRTLVEDMTSFFLSKNFCGGEDYPCEAYGLVKSCFFQGLNPYEAMVHSISSREVLVRSSRGLSEPGTLFKNLMAMLRDVVIGYDGTVRNVCSNSVIQFEYGVGTMSSPHSVYPAGEPVGILAATAISSPAYKAVLDSSSTSNSSWESMKEILQCKANFMNNLIDRRVILYLSDCGCGKRYCKENAACVVQNQLKRANLKDITVSFSIEYQISGGAALVGHIHLDKNRLNVLGRSMHEILLECQETANFYRKKKTHAHIFKRIILTVSECCYFQLDNALEWSPCIQLSWQDSTSDIFEETSYKMAHVICPILLETIIKGNPRVSAANIIWVGLDTTTWVKNPCTRTEKGEVALEILLEKTSVKKSGDAWRIVMDSCLPVMHLIDTRRSIPYAVKQVQELLGISSAFDQAIQRLSTSINLVTKGLLKEHLVLVANSMSCTGNLLGFHTSGYKALFRSLGVQVPFTEATLSKPRKCFEKAAEKCHMDSLSSTVASCSWGKHVAVGTGSRFELLWNTKEMGLEQEAGLDVYDFLQLVRSSNEGESNTYFCGEIDDLEVDVGDRELSLSPEINSELFFDDIPEISMEQNRTKDFEKSCESNWDIQSSLLARSDGSNDQWGSLKEPHADKSEYTRSEGWKNRESQGQLSQAAQSDPWSRQASTPDTSGWNKCDKKSQPCDSWSQQAVEADTGDWNKNEEKTEVAKWGEQSMKECPRSEGWNDKHSQGQLSQAEPSDSRSRQASESDTSGWNKNDTTSQPCDSWSKQTVEVDTSGWNKNIKKSEVDQWGEQSLKPSEESPSCAGWNDREYDKQISRTEPDDAWNKQAKKHNLNDGNYQRAQQKNSNDLDTSQPPSSRGWGFLSITGESDNKAQSQWGQQKESPLESHPWGSSSGRDGTENIEQSQLAQSTETPSSGWGSYSGGGLTDNQVKYQWNRPKESPFKSHAWDSSKGEDVTEDRIQSQWGQPKEASSSGWGSSSGRDGTENIEQSQLTLLKETSSSGWGSYSGGGLIDNQVKSQWDQPKESPSKSHAWNSTNGGDGTEDRVQSQWGQPKENSSSGWGSSCGGDGGEKKVQSQWGQPQGPSSKSHAWGSSSGWKNSGDWKQKQGQGRPPPGRQRMDQFTPEEQSILSDVDPIMQRIKRIMHQSSYNDGDQLSSDDQSFVLDSVFKYHPDNAAKMGNGVNYVMLTSLCPKQTGASFAGH